MSREKQIEEMAKATMKHCKMDNQCGSCPWLTCNECLAEVLYNAGYRKQSEVIRCKDCEHSYQVGDVRICRHWNYHATKDDAYCSYAKMKGGE